MLEVFKIGDWYISLSRNSTPREILVEVSTRCNLTCLHCFRNASSMFKHSEMDFNDYLKILTNAVNSGVEKIVFTGWGEPLVNPWIIDMIKSAKDMGLEVALNTNGVELDKYIEELVEIGLDEIYVSIDAVDIELYEKIRRLGDLSRVSRAISRINEYKANKELIKPVILSIFTITKLNLDQLPGLIKYATDIGIQEVYLSFYIHYPGGIPGVSCIDREECISRFREILDKLSVELINSPIKLWIPNINSYSFRSCPFAENRSLYVRVDGKVTPCMFLAYTWSIVIDDTERHVEEYIIGDALRESFIDIWRRHSKMYFKLVFNYMPSCLDCTQRKWCSYTLSTEADCWGNIPNCSFCPYHYRFSYCPI